jgi:hypothetical protein
LRRLLAALTLAVAGLMAIGSAQGASAPVTFTDTFSKTETFTDVVPCQESLGPYDITAKERGVFHVTAAGIEGEDNFIPPYHVTGTVTGSFVAVPSDGTGPTFTGRFTQWFGENSNLKNGNGTFTFSVRGRSSDGSRILFHVVAHFSVSASGVEVEFEKPSC